MIAKVNGLGPLGSAWVRLGPLGSVWLGLAWLGLAWLGLARLVQYKIKIKVKVKQAERGFAARRVAGGGGLAYNTL